MSTPSMTPAASERTASRGPDPAWPAPGDLADLGALLQPRPRGLVRLRTLVLLRWMAVAGQTATVLIVHYGFGFAVPLVPVYLAIGASAALNIALIGALPLDRLARPNEAAAQLGFDIVQLAVLTGLTGGLANPFVMLIIAPVAIGAAVLPRTQALGLGALASLCAGVLLLWHLPLPWSDPALAPPPPLFLSGVAMALIIAIMFAGLTASRGAAEAERMSAALAATQAVLAREERLAALGGLAAAAAHELGTPLATIQLTAKEMARALPEGDPMAEDAALLVGQAERCREILAKLSRGGMEADEVTNRAALPALLEEAAEPLRGLGPEIAVRATGDSAPPELRRGPETLFVLETLLENAVDFANAQVTATAWWNDDHIEVSIEDDGPGFTPDILNKLGEPYLTTRRGTEGGGGLGLGVFIATALIERLGGALRFSNRAEGGARAVASWPRNAIAARNQDFSYNRTDTEWNRHAAD